MLVLMLVICLFHVPQMFFENEAFMRFEVVPAEVVSSWNALRSGDFQSVRPAEFGTLLTYAFLHGDMDHLLGNLLFLWIFAALASELIGYRWMLAVFAITAICGGICHVALNRDDIVPMLGASGAVFGILAAYGMQFPNNTLQLLFPPVSMKAKYFVLIYAAIEVGLGLSPYQTGVAHFAHVGGALFGFLLILFWRKRGERMY